MIDPPYHLKNKSEFSDARFKAMVQTASDSIVIADENSFIVYANKKTYEIFGYPEGSLIGSYLEILIPEKYKQRYKSGIKGFMSKGDPKIVGHIIDLEGIRKDGRAFPLELSLSSWKEENGWFFAGIIRDNTEKKQTSLIFQNQQEELAAAEEELRTINEDLEHRVTIRTRELAETERKVKQSEEQFRLITDAVPVLISYLKTDKTYGFVNKAYEEVFQVNKTDIIGKHIKEVIGEKAYSTSLPLIEKALKGELVESEIFQDYGSIVGKMWRRATFVPHIEEEEIVGIFALVEDITKLKSVQIEQELANQKLREKDVFYQALIEHGADFITVFDEKLNYLYCGGAIIRKLGFKPEELTGENVLHFIHPGDIPKIKEIFLQVLASQEPIEISEFRFKDAKDEWRWLEATVGNQLQNTAVKGIVVSSRDITERVRSRIKQQQSEQRFKSLFDNHLDIVLYHNNNGLIADANAAALSFLQLQKQDVLNRQFSNFFTPDLAGICEQTIQRAINGESVRYEIEIPFAGRGVFTFDIVKIPVWVDGKVMGVYSILRDITERSDSNKIIKRQAEKMNTIFESITDAFFTLDRNWIFTYTNSEFNKIIRLDKEQVIGKSIWEVFPEEVGGKFYKQYHCAVDTGKAAHFDAYYEELNMWLQVKAYPSEEGLSVYFDDITERVKSRQELKKLSLVASKTTNGVIITDANGLIEWVNEGFTRLTGYTLAEIAGKNPISLLQGKETNKDTAERLEENLKQGKPFTDEILNYKKSGEKVWVLLDTAPVRNEDGEIIKFTSIQTDITERKEAEKNQLQMTNDLFRQNRDLQQFTYIVSHNLRSPVASILGLADMLTTTDDRNSETYEISLGYLKSATDQLDSVIRDLNQILSIRNNKAATNKVKVEVVSVCQQVITALQEPLNECKGKVIIDIEEGVSVKGNKAYLYSIFYNLLSNSIKYRSPSRNLIVSIRCKSSDNGVAISFSDNGIGFDMKKVGDDIFKLYKRFHVDFEGRGIGLFLVKTHVEAMDGHIEVDSTPNAGTTFFFTL